MRIYDNGTYRDMTAEEIAVLEHEAKKATAIEAGRPFTEAEVSRMLITAQVNTLSVDDKTALRMKEFYPEWESGVSYASGFKVQRSGKLFRALQAHTAQIGWEPESAASLWEQINEIHTGTIDDPIPYNGNMDLEAGKHYIQNAEIYRCTRDTVNPVYNALADLVDLYVEIA